MVRGLGRGGAVLLLLLTLLPAHRTQEPSYRYVFYDGDEAEYDSPQVSQEKHTQIRFLILYNNSKRTKCKN
jgi:hypothetical protein